jgi:hypothetical protein
MQRVIPRPSITWLLLLGLLVASGVLTATRGLGQLDKAATCVGYGSGYGPATPAPVLTLNLAASRHLAGTPVAASGKLTQAGCDLHDETVHIQRRVVVNGAPAGNWVTLTNQPVTGADGTFTTTVYSVYDSAFRAFVLPRGSRPGAFSSVSILNTHIRLSVYAPSGSHNTVARICGRTVPYKGGQVVILYLYNTTLNQWKALDVTSVGAGSIYCFAGFLPQGSHSMAVNIPADTVNQRGIKFFTEVRT